MAETQHPGEQGQEWQNKLNTLAESLRNRGDMREQLYFLFQHHLHQLHRKQIEPLSGDHNSVEALTENLLGEAAENTTRYRQATTHSSAYPREAPPNTRQGLDLLEYYGDAVLAFRLKCAQVQLSSLSTKAMRSVYDLFAETKPYLGPAGHHLGLQHVLCTGPDLQSVSVKTIGETTEAVIGAASLANGEAAACTVVDTHIIGPHRELLPDTTRAGNRHAQQFVKSVTHHEGEVAALDAALQEVVESSADTTDVQEWLRQECAHLLQAGRQEYSLEGNTHNIQLDAKRLERLERRIGYEFKQKHLLHMALETPGNVEDPRKNNSRLTYVGATLLVYLLKLHQMRTDDRSMRELMNIESDARANAALEPYANECRIPDEIIANNMESATTTNSLANIVKALLAAIHFDNPDVPVDQLMEKVPIVESLIERLLFAADQ